METLNSQNIGIEKPNLAWPSDRVKDLAAKIGSGVTPAGGATSYVDSGVPLLRSQNIHFDGLRLDDVAFITESTHTEMAGTRVQSGDVLLNITGASIGRCTFVPSDLGEANVNQHVCIIRPLARIDHRFLSYFLSSPWGQDQILSSFTGASRQGLGQKELGGIEVPLPPLPEQGHISAYLDESCTALDGAVLAKRSQLETLNRVRDSIIESAVTKGIHKGVRLRPVGEEWIGDVPEHWNVCRIKRILSKVDYGISEKTEPEGRFPVLKMAHIQDGEIVFSESDLDFVDAVADDLLLEKDDILYNRTNSPDQVGKAGLFRGSKKEGVTFASYLVRLRTNHKADPRFFNYLVNCSGFLGFARKMAIPSVQQSNLNSTRYCRMLIPLPPRKEQEAIAEYLDAKLADMQRVAAVTSRQVDALIVYRKSLIHEFVTGQRRVTEANLKRVQRNG